jgi:transcription elongation factor SPT5
MRKYLDYQGTDHELRIKSVVARETLKGYIYIEARSMSDVQAAVDKMNNIYASKISIVPMEEMVDVVTIRKKVVALRPGSWVRISRGKFKGDLAQVVDVFENEDTAEVKVIPRMAPEKKESGPKRKAGVAREPPRLLVFKDLDRAEIRHLNEGRFNYKGDIFDDQGFQYRTVKLNLLHTDGVRPSLEELARFSVTAEGERERAALVSSITDQADDQSMYAFSVGDRVVVNEGELKNALGTVLTVDRNSVVVTMQDEALGEVTFEPSKLSKFYQLGDHVKVIRGKHKDDMGMITQVQDQVITIFSDLSLEQISVFSKDIQSVGEVSMTDNQQGGVYKLHDFVQVG